MIFSIHGREGRLAALGSISELIPSISVFLVPEIPGRTFRIIRFHPVTAKLQKFGPFLKLRFFEFPGVAYGVFSYARPPELLGRGCLE